MQSGQAPYGDAAERTRVALAEEILPSLAYVFDLDKAVAHAGRLLDRIRKTCPVAPSQDETVHDDRDRMLVLLVQYRNLIVEHIALPIDDDTGVAGLERIGEDLLELALPAHGYGRQHDETATLLMGEDRVDDLVHRHLGDLPAAFGTVHMADACI